MANDDRRFGISVKAAAEYQRRRGQEEEQERLARLAVAQKELSRAVEHITTSFSCRRVIVWGSLLHPERFSRLSDIDIAVEGIESLAEWSRLERELLDMTTMPLHLVRWEEPAQIHRERILARGTIVYEAP